MLKYNYAVERNIITCGPGRSIFASPAPLQNSFDMQLNDHNYPLPCDPHPAMYTERIHDLTWLRQRWSDFSPAVRKALDTVDSAFKWRFATNAGVPAWSRGNVVLLGDAVHGMTPFSGQGSAMGIEDGAVLSSLLASSDPGDELKIKLEMFERIRRPRVERVQKMATALGHIWTAREARKVAKRNQSWRARWTGYSDAKASMEAAIGSVSFFKWLDEWNPFTAVREHIEEANPFQARL